MLALVSAISADADPGIGAVSDKAASRSAVSMSSLAFSELTSTTVSTPSVSLIPLPASSPSPVSASLDLESLGLGLGGKHGTTVSWLHSDATCPARSFTEVQREYIKYPSCPQQPRLVPDTEIEDDGLSESTQWSGMEIVAETTGDSGNINDTGVSTGTSTTTAVTAVASDGRNAAAVPFSRENAPTSTDSSATFVSTTDTDINPGSKTAVPQLTHDDGDGDSESPLDNAKFLSFEEWKKQNLAKAGQSAENNRADSVTSRKGELRPRPGIDNSLDSLGEESEITLDFTGFAPENARPASWMWPGGASLTTAGDGRGSQRDAEVRPATGIVGETDGGEVGRGGGLPRRKNAGVTCKERTNYASFDCAATVLRTNKQSTGSSSILIEHKDSYMLNECDAKNKFIIVELCEDILIDTVVLANYEFFSSIFRTFRVSVSDRYPPKGDKWKELGVFQALNTREVQAFPVENPLIWAKYIKIEFLTHYGKEFYCPISLLRVHGTTMLEEYKIEGESARGDEDVAEEVVDTAQAVVEPVMNSSDPVFEANADDAPVEAANATSMILGEQPLEVCTVVKSEIESVLLGRIHIDVCDVGDAPKVSNEANMTMSLSPSSITASILGTQQSRPVTSETSSLSGQRTETATATQAESKMQKQTPELRTNSTADAVKSSAANKADVTSTEHARLSSSPSQHIRSSSSPSQSGPSPPNPTTQESFFKSVNKRLHMLESNSTLSLLYIEEQSRMLRDAFSKVEKRQLAKTTTFLENLNRTVLHELRDFRAQYDQVWQTVVIEFEQQRQQYKREVYAVNSQLGVLADELVFQKRLSLIQNLFVLVCFGAILFARNTVRPYLELPGVNSVLSRTQSFRLSSRSPSPSPSSSPLQSPSSATGTGSGSESEAGLMRRRRQHHRRNYSDVCEEAAYQLPTEMELGRLKPPDQPGVDITACADDVIENERTGIDESMP